MDLSLLKKSDHELTPTLGMGHMAALSWPWDQENIALTKKPTDLDPLFSSHCLWYRFNPG